METKTKKLSHGWSPEDIKPGDTILVINVKRQVYQVLIPAYNYESHSEGYLTQEAKIEKIEKFGGCWMINTSCGLITLFNNHNGEITFVK